MKGYVWVTYDKRIHSIDSNYVDTENPNFFMLQPNVDTYWSFDTEDVSSMNKIFAGFKRKEVKTLEVELFCASVGFDLQAFLESRKKLNENNVQSH